MRVPVRHFFQPLRAPEAPGGGGGKAPTQLSGLFTSADARYCQPVPPAGMQGCEALPPAGASVSLSRFTGDELVGTASPPVAVQSLPTEFICPVTKQKMGVGEINDTYLDTVLRVIVKELVLVQELFFDSITAGVDSREAAALAQNIVFENGRVAKFIEYLKIAAAAYGARIGAPQLDKIYTHRLTNRLTYIQGKISLAELGLISPERAVLDREISRGYEAKSVASLLVEINKLKKEVVVARKKAQGNAAFEFNVVLRSRDVDPIALTEAHAFALEEILIELIRNAEKYSDKKMSIRFDESQRCYVVTNDGYEIPTGFNPFKEGERAEAVRHIQGTGYGLASLLPIAEKNGWRLTYTSEFGLTEFRLWI